MHEFVADFMITCLFWDDCHFKVIFWKSTKLWCSKNRHSAKTGIATHSFKFSFLFLISHSTCIQSFIKFSALELIPVCLDLLVKSNNTFYQIICSNYVKRFLFLLYWQDQLFRKFYKIQNDCLTRFVFSSALVSIPQTCISSPTSTF